MDKVTTSIIDTLTDTITDTGLSDGLATKLDTNLYSSVGEIYFELEVATNTTAPGSSKTITISYTQSAKDVTPPEDIIPLVPDLITSLTAITVQNSTSTSKIFKTAQIPYTAPFLYFWVDVSTLTSGAELDLTIRIVNIKKLQLMAFS